MRVDCLKWNCTFNRSICKALKIHIHVFTLYGRNDDLFPLGSPPTWHFVEFCEHLLIFIETFLFVYNQRYDTHEIKLKSSIATSKSDGISYSENSVIWNTSVAYTINITENDLKYLKM